MHGETVKFTEKYNLVHQSLSSDT